MNPDDLDRYPSGLRALVASLPAADAWRLLARYDRNQAGALPGEAKAPDWYTPEQEAILAQTCFNSDPGGLTAFNPYRRD